MSLIGAVAGLHRFPVKSMQGESLDEVTLDPGGIVGDRVRALRDAETGKLVSAKRPSRWRAVLDCRADGRGGRVAVTLPSGDSYGIDEPGLPVALEALLGRSVTIERSGPTAQGIYESEWPEIEGLTLAGPLDLPTNLGGDGTSFVDVAALHVLTTTAMASVTPEDAAGVDPDGNDLVVDVRRFRPGIVLDTPDLTGFPENGWAGATIRFRPAGDDPGGDRAEILVGDPTPRCVMTTVEQGGLPRQPDVLRRIADLNRQTNPFGTFACLGAYVTVARPGVVRAGDVVELVEATLS